MVNALATNSKTYIVQVREFEFFPRTLRVKRNETVEWKLAPGINDGHLLMRIQANEVGSFCFNGSTASFAYVFKTKGSVEYSNAVYPFMRGVILVDVEEITCGIAADLSLNTKSGAFTKDTQRESPSQAPSDRSEDAAMVHSNISIFQEDAKKGQLLREVSACNENVGLLKNRTNVKPIVAALDSADTEATLPCVLGGHAGMTDHFLMCRQDLTSRTSPQHEKQHDKRLLLHLLNKRHRIKRSATTWSNLDADKFVKTALDSDVDDQRTNVAESMTDDSASRIARRKILSDDENDSDQFWILSRRLVRNGAILPAANGSDLLLLKGCNRPLAPTDEQDSKTHSWTEARKPEDCCTLLDSKIRMASQVNYPTTATLVSDVLLRGEERKIKTAMSTRDIDLTNHHHRLVAGIATQAIPVKDEGPHREELDVLLHRRKCCTETTAGRIWNSTMGGVYEFDPSAAEFFLSHRWHTANPSSIFMASNNSQLPVPLRQRDTSPLQGQQHHNTHGAVNHGSTGLNLLVQAIERHSMQESMISKVKPLYYQPNRLANSPPSTMKDTKEEDVVYHKGQSSREDDKNARTITSYHAQRQQRPHRSKRNIRSATRSEAPTDLQAINPEQQHLYAQQHYRSRALHQNVARPGASSKAVSGLCQHSRRSTSVKNFVRQYDQHHHTKRDFPVPLHEVKQSLHLSSNYLHSGISSTLHTNPATPW